MTKWNVSVILSDLVLALVINTSATLLSGAQLSFVSWYPGCACAFFTNVLLRLVLPVPAWGQALTRAFEGRPRRWLVSIFVENLVFVSCISLTMALVNTGGPGLLEAWLATYVYLVLIGYLTSLVLYGVNSRIAILQERNSHVI